MRRGQVGQAVLRGLAGGVVDQSVAVDSAVGAAGVARFEERSVEYNAQEHLETAVGYGVCAVEVDAEKSGQELVVRAEQLFVSPQTENAWQPQPLLNSSFSGTPPG